MRIVETYSHLGGQEHAIVHAPTVWDEVRASITAADSITNISADLVELGWTPSGAGRVVRNRIAVEVPQGNSDYSIASMYPSQFAAFAADHVDMGIEILPMGEFQGCLSFRPPRFETALYDLLRQGRSTPAVPLVLIGVAP